MAISSAAATVSSIRFDRRTVTSSSSKLSTSTTLPFLLSRGPSSGNRRVSSVPQRRILPRVQAKQQTFSSFNEMLAKSDKPVLVDFYATWCGPCQYMVSVLNQVGAALKDKIQVVKIDTEKYPTIANQYDIQALPTLIIFREGKPCDRLEGALPADQLMQRIENVLNGAL
ncbi:hypothetical protein H6P81_015583 [Aristolochia fimbriata]|uniref:Thioredoxin domain-containing protein n=1 Tax=Aristolochia fimbriata TaxID=158543 RepID=A0AAV7EAJ6_ARIFI|nr:hypothetical protein H6P81_015583 [Aristolochia fimbriata]